MMHRIPRNLGAAPLAAAMALAALPARAQLFQNDFAVEFHGAGWMSAGTIGGTTDTVSSKNNYAGNYLENAGALFNMRFRFTPELDGALGIGAIKAHNPMGTENIGNIEGVQLGNFSFINMARLTWNKAGTGSRSPLSLTSGLFNYKYDDNVRNLGLYLIRGAVYPQILVSGFETKEFIESGNMLGFHLRSDLGESFTQDVLLVSETELKPKYDFSLIYVAAWRPGGGFELGGGVNFYHYLPVRGDATSPSEEHFDGSETDNNGISPSKAGMYDRKYAIDLPGQSDTLSNPAREWYSHKGIKVMGRFAFDPKAAFGLEGGALGRNDLKLYGEAAIIGLKNYGVIYTKMSERIPVMAGFNLPTFGLLDDFAVEVEYFPSPYMPDYAKIMEYSSPIPRSPNYNRSDSGATAIPYDVKADDWKWSVYVSKVLAGHVKLSAQMASDHFRIGAQQPWFPTYDETFSTWKDWYLMGKLTFFF